jgi:hypothetical protein
MGKLSRYSTTPLARMPREKELEQIGPHLRALPPKAQRFVLEWFYGPSDYGAATRAARIAGYDEGENADNAKIAAHRLLHSPGVAAALDELGGKFLRPEGLAAIKEIISIGYNLEIDSRVRLKALTFVANLGGYIPETHHTVHVEQSRKETVLIASEEILARIAELAGRVGVDAQRQIEAAKTINGSAVEVEHEPAN